MQFYTGERIFLKSEARKTLNLQLIILSIIIIFLFTMIFPVRLKITEIITDYKIQIIEVLEQKIDHKISYDSIAPSILHAFEIRNFRISSKDNPDEYLINIEKLRMQFNLFKFRFANPLNAFNGLLIVNSNLVYDDSKNSELINIFKTLTSSQLKSTEADTSLKNLQLPDNFTIRGRNIGLDITLGTFSAELSKVFLTIGTSYEKDLTISLKADSSITLGKMPENFPFEKLHINTELKLTGRTDTELGWVDLDITTKTLESDIISVNKISWNLKYSKPGYIKLTKTGDNIPADISFTADIPGGLYDLNLQAQDFIFDKYFQSSDFISSFEPLTGAVISGEASLNLDTNDAKSDGAVIGEDLNIEYSGDLEIKNISGLFEQPLSIYAVFSGRNKTFEVSESVLSANIGRAGFTGLVNLENKLPLINGRLRIPQLTYEGFVVSADMRLKSSLEGGYSVSSNSIDINGLNLSGFLLEMFPYGDNLEFSFNTDIVSHNHNLEHLYSEGIIQLGSNYYIQAVLAADGVLAAPIIAALPSDFKLPEILSEFEITTELFISGTLKQLSFASPEIRLNDRTNIDRSLSFSIAGNNSSIRMSELMLRWDNNRLSGKLASDFTENGNLILQTNLNLNDTTVSIAGVFDTEGNLSLSGDYGLKLNWFNRGFILNSNRLPLNTASGDTVFLSINSTGYFNSAEDWKLLMNNIEIDELPTGFGSGNFKMAALFSETGGNIYNINYKDNESSLSGGGSVLLTKLLPFPSGRLHLNISSEDRTEDYSLLLGLNDERIEGNIDFTNFPVSRLSQDLPVSGDLYGSVLISGSLDSPNLRLIFNTGNAFINNEKLNIEATLSYSDMTLNIDNIAGSYGSFAFNNFDGLINFQNGKHKITGSLTSDSRLLQLSANLSASANTIPINSVFNLRDIFSEDIDAVIAADTISFNSEQKEPWRLKFIKHDKMLNIAGGSGNEINANFFEDGYFTLDAEAPFPISISASGTVKDQKINATVKEMHYIVNNLEIPLFKFYEGELAGNFRIQGQLNDPDFFGRIDLSNMVFKPPIVEDITKPFATSFFLSGKELTLPATRVATNNGTIDINLTTTMERWLPRIYDININVPEKEAISALFYRRPIYIYGFATGTLHLYGDFGHMYLDGDLKGSEAVFMVNDDIAAGSIGVGMDRFTSKMHFDFGENNQFIWPNQNYPILKGYLQGGSELTMFYDSTSGLVLDGTLDLNGGEIFYFERNFYIKEGNVSFISNIRDSRDPLFSTRAEIRDINSEGEMSKIYLIVDRSPLSSFIPRFESEPSMSTAEILSLLGGNILDTFESGTTTVENTLLLGADLATQFFVMKGIEDNLKKTLGIDLLSIRSSFLSNFLENNLFSFSEETTQINLANYLDNTTLFLGKYFTDDIFLQGMFQFDLYNDTGYSENPELNFDSEIKLEWESPVANVELNFYPDFVDPLEGLNNTSLGLSWRFSY